MAKITLSKIIRSTSVGIFSALLTFNVMASTQQCPNGETQAFDETQLHILTSADLELEEHQKSIAKVESRTEQSVSWFSWLTKSHSMPSLHFLDFLELFKK